MRGGEEGWKEFKIGAVFTAAVHAAWEPTGDERRNVVHACDIRHVAHIGGSEALGELVWAEAQRRGWEHAHATLALGDGAPWIWNQTALHFGAGHQLVDWYHARHYLAAAGQALHGQNDAARQRWLDSRETHRSQGLAACIAEELLQTARQHPEQTAVLERKAGSFRERRQRMNDLKMHEEGWPIASSMVESGAKQRKARFCGTGMRWSRQGAERLLPVRAAILSQRFDELWTRVFNSPPN